MILEEVRCTNCGALLKADYSKSAITCPYCGTPYIVKNNAQSNNMGTTNGGFRVGSLFDFNKMEQIITQLNVPIGYWGYSIKKYYNDFNEREKQFVNDRKTKLQRDISSFTRRFKTPEEIISFLESSNSIYKSVSVKRTEYILGDYSWKQECSTDGISFDGKHLSLADRYSGPGSIEYDIGALSIWTELFFSEYGTFADKNGLTQFCIAKADETSIDIIFKQGRSPYTTEVYNYVKMELVTKTVNKPQRKNHHWF